jgi:uncharacterized membrane protein YqaE (UPF0057 family)
MLNNLKRAEFFALIAAIFNGSIGVFTRFGFNSGKGFWLGIPLFLIELYPVIKGVAIDFK